MSRYAGFAEILRKARNLFFHRPVSGPHGRGVKTLNASPRAVAPTLMTSVPKPVLPASQVPKIVPVESESETTSSPNEERGTLLSNEAAVA